MCKRLRFDGFKFRYLVVGEYGTSKRRAHWHAILFWYGSVPDIQTYKDQFTFDYWAHGYSYWEKLHPAAVRYVCKYIQKDIDDEASESRLRMSKKPPLGDAWIKQFAQEHVEQGLSPQTLHYSFQSVTHKDGKRKQFYMTGTTADNYLRYYVRAFIRKHGHIKYPHSQLVDEWVEKQFQQAFDQRYWMKEQKDGSQVSNQIKKDAIYKAAQQHGGVEYYGQPLGRLEPFAICKNGVQFDYAQIIEDHDRDLSRPTYINDFIYATAKPYDRKNGTYELHHNT
jgi:hypothetical protein